MERVYEGVYQFLEFFAVLTENNDWKSVLVEWELAYDLCTLIKELDASIPRDPKLPSAAASAAAAGLGRADSRSRIADADASVGTATNANNVERPYSPTQPPNDGEIDSEEPLSPTPTDPSDVSMVRVGSPVPPETPATACLSCCLLFLFHSPHPS